MRSSTQHVGVVGYLDPHKDVREGTVTTNDLAIWKPNPRRPAMAAVPLPEAATSSVTSDPFPVTDDDVDKAKFILGLIGDQFCDMLQQEQKCLSVNREVGSENGLQHSHRQVVVWKRSVKGVREMCDVCQTSIFNYHWTCGKCGVFVCLDCVKFRTSGLVKDQVCPQLTHFSATHSLCLEISIFQLLFLELEKTQSLLEF